MKIIENTLKRKSKTVFRQLRKIISHLSINSFTHIPFFIPFSAIGVLYFVIVAGCNTTEPDDGKITPSDTTTQNFTFETYEFGDGYNSSYFNDVWIFNEDNIWAVGYVNVTSNTGRINIVQWNGKNWVGRGRQFDSGGIEGVWAIDSSHIYFAVGIVLRYDNGKFQWEDFNEINFSQGQSVHKLWGSSENNIYGVGPNGTIVHFDGQTWSKIDFDTQWRFDDITGDKESGIAYAVALGNNFATGIVELNNSSANIIYNSKTLTSYSIEMLTDTELLLSNLDIWKFNLTNKKAEIFCDLSPGYYLPLSAKSAANDLYFFGNKLSSGEKMIHYNRSRFKIFDMPERDDVIYGGSYAINNLAIMTGFSHNKAYLVKVKRE